MGSIYNVAKKLADEGNPIAVILAAIQSMEDGAKPAKRGKDGSPRCELERVLDPMRAQALLDHRQAKGAKLTAYAAKLLAEQLEATGNPADACDLIISRGWQGFNAKWYVNEQQNNRGGMGYSQQRPNSVVEARRQALAERVSDGHGYGRDRGSDTYPARQLALASGDQRDDRRLL